MGNYSGTNNGVTFTTGKLGANSFSFNGSSNFIALPQAALNFNKGNSGQSIGDFSVSFWLNLNTGSGDYQTVIGNWGDNGFGWQVVMFGGSFKFFGSDGSNGSTARIQHSLGLSKANATNQWVHVVVTYTNQSQVKSYVNGMLTNTTSTIYQIRTNSRNNGNLGCWPQSGDNSSTKYWFLNGKLDAVTLWTKALTEAEASALYNGGTGYQYSFPSSVIGYTPSPNDAVSANHGTLMNGATFTDGKIGQAFTFDGVNDYVQLPDNSLNINGAFSYSFWIKASNTTDYTIIVGNVQNPRGSYSHVHGYQYWLSAGKLQTGYNNGVGISVGQTTTATIANGAWNHVVATYNPNNATTGSKVYINGTLDSQTTSLGLVNPIGYSSPMKACIGARNFNGSTLTFLSNGTSIDALSAWNKELTSTEITELYNSGTGKQYPNY